MLETKYNHLNVEKNKYEEWKSKGYFEPKDNGKGKFSIVLPPPNVTGKLHIGHAWDTTLQDIIVRFKRMQGYETMWLPGMDHAAIATESKVVAKLKSEGINKYELGREGFLKEAWKDVEGASYHIKYYLENSDKYLRVATTRPETLFGDTAVAVNPNDERYKEYIGKNVILPIVNKPIPIVADEHVDPEFGTGVVKRTSFGTKLKNMLKVKGSLGYSY